MLQIRIGDQAFGRESPTRLALFRQFAAEHSGKLIPTIVADENPRPEHLFTLYASNMASVSRFLLRRRPSLMMSVYGNLSTDSAKLDGMLDELKTNPYYEKYADKIAEMQKVSPEELQKKIHNLEETKKKAPAKADAKERPFSCASSVGKPDMDGNARMKPKLLDDVMKTELLRDKTAEEIKELWIDYHKTKDVIVAVLPGELYSVMEERGKEFSTFLLPIPRSQGYEFIMCQFLGHGVHFTPLISYQAHKENAPECLTMTFYPDLKEEKGIVLMKGEYDKNILNCQEAQCLANELQLYYSQNNNNRISLLRKFTYSPNEFDHMDLIKELETLSI